MVGSDSLGAVGAESLYSRRAHPLTVFVSVEGTGLSAFESPSRPC
jgi:hypothetical protein